MFWTVLVAVLAALALVVGLALVIIHLRIVVGVLAGYVGMGAWGWIVYSIATMMPFPERVQVWLAIALWIGGMATFVWMADRNTRERTQKESDLSRKEKAL